MHRHLTCGGDVPGLNAVIKSVVYRATEDGHDVLGLRRGWEALTHVQPALPNGGGTATCCRSTGKHPHHRPDRRDDAAHVAQEPAKMKAAGLPPWLAAADRGAVRGRPTGSTT